MRLHRTMRKRYSIGAGVVLLVVLLALVEWQVSFTFGNYAPKDPTQTVAFWAISTVVFLLTVTLGFMLFKTGVRLYLERRGGREGSRIQSKLVFGALALSILPVAFLFAFSYMILNRNLDKWFSRPGENTKIDLLDTAVALGDEVQSRARRAGSSASQWASACARLWTSSPNATAVSNKSIFVFSPGRLNHYPDSGSGSYS